MDRIISKFGGSSVANATQFTKIKDIITEEPKRSIVVVSAPGKDDLNTSKVTDLLLLLHAHIEYHIPYDELLHNIYERFNKIVKMLHLSKTFDESFQSFTASLNKSLSRDYVASRGEYFTALIMSEYLGFEFLDAKDIIFVHYDGTIDYEKTTQKLNDFLKDQTSYVIPGFYASTPEHKIRVFNRGGSDLTGSIIAVCINASLYENWTDVNGLYVADPSLIDHPDKIEKITYAELRELSYRGASVLQQESLIPLEKTDITIHLKNTNEPDAFGTMIRRDIKNNGNIITGMSGTTDFTSLTITKDSTIDLTQILIDVLKIFTKYKINVEHIPTGIDTFSMIVKTNNVKKVYFDVMNDLRQVSGIIDITTEDNIALIAIVGRNMSFIPGIAGKIFSTLGDHKTNIKVIAQASNEISIIIGVKKDDYKSSLVTLYQAFYQSKQSI